MKIVLATKNPGKLKELTEMAAGLADGIELVLAPDQFDPEETGATYLENAVIKATEAARMTNLISIADDSGLEVDAMDGRPGVHSARYCQGSDGDRRRKLLGELANVPEGKRQAQFVCWMAVCDPNVDRSVRSVPSTHSTYVDRSVRSVPSTHSTYESESIIYKAKGIWRGRIGFDERGSGGFGFDPIFYETDSDVTAAQLPAQEKNRKSHRGQAWGQVLSFLEKSLIR